MYGNKKHLRFIKQFWIQKQFLFNNWNYAFFIHHKKKDNQRHFYCAIISKAAPTGLPVFVSVFVSTCFIPLIWLTQCSCSCVNSNRKHLSVPTIAFCRSFGLYNVFLVSAFSFHVTYIYSISNKIGLKARLLVLNSSHSWSF